MTIDLIDRDTLLPRIPIKKHIKEAERKSRIAFCSRSNDTFGNLYKFIKGKNLRANDVMFTSLDAAMHFSSFDDIAAILMRKHFNVDDLPPDIYEFIFNEDHSRDYGFIHINKRELKHALGQQSLHQVPGYDGIDAVTICCNNLTDLRKIS